MPELISGIKQHRIYIDGQLHSTVGAGSLYQVLTSLSSNTDYQVTIKTEDNAGNISAEVQVDFKTLISDNSSGIILDSLRAFPTSVGANSMRVSGARGGNVKWVTSETGDGSFERVFGNCEDGDTIMFAIGGMLDVTGESLSGGGNFYKGGKNITVAGQSAHSLGGINLRLEYGRGFAGELFYLSVENFVMRYVGLVGDAVPTEGEPQNGDPWFYLNHNDTFTMPSILDHVSSCGNNSTNGMIDIRGATTSFCTSLETVDYSHAPIREHDGYELQTVGFGTYCINASDRTKPWDNEFLFNFLGMAGHRSPQLFGDYAVKQSWVNNFVFSWDNQSPEVNHGGNFHFINNVYKEDATMIDEYGHHGEGDRWVSGQFFSFDNDNQNTVLPDDRSVGKIYAKNTWFLKPDNSELRTEDTPNIDFTIMSGTENMLEQVTVSEVTPNSLNMLELLDTEQSLQSFISDTVGAGARFANDGTVSNDYEWEARYIDYAKNGRLLGTRATRTAYVYDTPKNIKTRSLTDFELAQGFPESWATLHGLDTSDIDVRNRIKVDWQNLNGMTVKNNAGYTNLEMYLAELAGDFILLKKMQSLNLL